MCAMGEKTNRASGPSPSWSRRRRSRALRPRCLPSRGRPGPSLPPAGFAVLFLLLILAVLGSCPEVGAASIHHDLTVELKPLSHSLSARDHVVFKAPGMRDCVFLLSGRADIKSVSAGGTAARYDFRAGVLTVFPDPSRMKGPAPGIDIAYDAVFDDPVPTAPASFDNPGFGVSGTISETGTFLLSGSGWYPRIEPPDHAGRKGSGESSFNIRIVAPRGVYAVTAGKLKGMTDEGGRSVTTWEVENIGEGLALSAAKYSVRSERTGKVPVYTFFFPGSDSLSQTYLDAASSHIAFYSRLHGPYGFPKFAVVENFFPTGYGFPSYTLLGSTVLRLPFIPQTSLRHEVAHCWWGNGVLVAPDSGNWCEGLTTYVADYLSTELASPRDALEYRLRMLRDYATLAASGRDFPLADFTARTDPATRAVGYDKAAFVFHMIRRKLGDEPFWRSLRRIYRERFQVETSWEDFRKVFAAEGGWSERESKRFFEQWVAQSGAPKLRLEGVSAKRIPKGWEVSGNVVQSTPPFDLDLGVRLTASNGEKVEKKIKISGASSPFVFRSTGVPRKLAADPDVNVFRLLAPEEIPASVNSLKSSKGLTAVLCGDVSREKAGPLQTLLAGLDQEGAAIVSEREMDLSEIGKKDVLLFGFPESERLRVVLARAPEGLKISRGGFSLARSFTSDSADSLFAVWTDPQRGGKLTALFLSTAGLAAEPAAAAARKITHYGRYSYLAFARGTNVAKGTWDIAGSPLVVTFKDLP